MSSNQNSCKRCGQCCQQGGAALHSQDLDLISAGKIPLSALITLRKGELAHNPVKGGLHAISCELVKLKGTGRDWNCYYYDSGSGGCSIYDHRPVACVALKCWDTEEVLAMVEKDTLNRQEILALFDDNPLAPLVAEHERLYPCPDMADLVRMGADLSEKMKRELHKLVNEDVRFRNRVVREFNLKVSEELFYFGRPVFQLLQPLGVRVKESQLGLELHYGPLPNIDLKSG